MHQISTSLCATLSGLVKRLRFPSRYALITITGMEARVAKRLPKLEAETSRLKKPMARAALDNLLSLPAREKARITQLVRSRR